MGEPVEKTGASGEMPVSGGGFCGREDARVRHSGDAEGDDMASQSAERMIEYGGKPGRGQRSAPAHRRGRRGDERLRHRGRQGLEIGAAAEDAVTIGRNRDCTITLPHVSVSRLHARLTQDSRGWTLSDALFTVTHSTLQLKLCDRIVFMGKGGNLCF